MDVDVSVDELDKGVQSLSVEDLEKGFQSPFLDEDSLLGEEVPSVDGPKALVPNVEPSTRKKWRTKLENLQID